MCGRFFVEGESENELLARMISEAERRQRALTGDGSVARGEVFPGATAAAVAVGKNGGVGVYPMQWGFHLASGGRLVINTRSETALDKPLFNSSMRERRCLIPCSWYFEWEARDAQQSLLENTPSLQIQAADRPDKKRPKNQVRIKYAIRPKAPGVIFLAGIYRYEEALRLPVFSVLTREPSPNIAFIHDRMPVIFTEKTRGAWLDRDADPRELLKLCETAMVYRAA